jgi:type I restriction enzyme S subunit
MMPEETVQLGNVIRVHYGKGLKTSARDANGPHDVYGSNGPVGKHKFFLVDYPTIVIGRKGSIGAVTYAPYGGWPIDTTYYVQILDRERLDLRYLYYALRRARLGKYAITTSIPGLNREDIYKTKIALPPLGEQRRTAATLDKADAIRRKRREAIRLMEEFLRSVFLDMFGDPVANTKGWKVGTMDEIVDNPKSDIRCGPFGTQLKVKELVSSGIPILGIDNVHSDHFIVENMRYLSIAKAEQLSRFDTRHGDVLITRMGTIGRACVVPVEIKEARISYHLFRVRPNPQKCLPEFLSASVCRSGTFQSQLSLMAHGAIMDGLSTSNLREIRFLLPPVSRQEEYVRIVKQVERGLNTNNRALSEAEGFFGSLIQRAFRGEL